MGDYPPANLEHRQPGGATLRQSRATQGENDMLTKKMIWVVLMFAASLAVPAAKADPQCFTLDSLDGNHAVIGTYGANVARALGTRHFDGNGNLTGNFILNEPTPGSTTGARTLVTGTQVGTYTVNCDGTGVITRTLTASTGL